MALTTTTLAAAAAASDTSVTVTSATGFAAGSYLQVDNEFMQISKSYVSGTAIPVHRGVNGTFADAHVSGANATVGTGSDFSNPSATVIVPYPLSARRRKVTSYSASGAITLPNAGEDIVAVLNGTSVLAMTVAAPGKDQDGSILYVVGNGAAAHTLTVSGTSGLGGAGTGYTVLTVNASAPVLFLLMAVNGLWVSVTAPAWTGTVTKVVAGLA